MDGYVPISDRTPEELLARAAEVRRMAGTATTFDVSEALLRLAERYEAAAADRETGSRKDAGEAIA
jgi:hypothetical protein